MFYKLDFYDQYRPLSSFLIEYYGTPWEMQQQKIFLSQLWYSFVGSCSSFVNRRRLDFPFGIWLHQYVVWMHQNILKTEHWSPGRPAIIHVLSHVWLHQNTFGARLSTSIWRSWRLNQLMGQEAQRIFVTCNDRNWLYWWTGAIICESLVLRGLEWTQISLVWA